MILAILVEPIKAEFALSDTQVGLLTGLAFAFFYATFGIPIARMADVGNRRNIIAWSLAAWSVMTVLCGMAQSFVQLLLARVGVAVGEAGAVPPSHSLIADYFSPEKRAMALSLFTVGSTVGYLIGFAAGGIVAEIYGWRMAFLLVGTPGVLFAVLIRLTLKEPRESNKISELDEVVQDASLSDAARLLLHKKSYLFIVLGFACYSVLSYGATQWVASFLIRSHGMGIAEVGIKYGLVVSVSTGLGVLFGGWLSDKLYTTDPRWMVRIPTLCCIAAFPVSIFVFTLADTHVVIALMGVLGFFFGATTPPAMAAIHVIAGERRRALAIAFTFLLTNIVGLGMGPVFIGFLSDTLQANMGADALGQSILYTHILLLLAGLFFYRAEAFLRSDFE